MSHLHTSIIYFFGLRFFIKQKQSVIFTTSNGLLKRRVRKFKQQGKKEPPSPKRVFGIRLFQSRPLHHGEDPSSDLSLLKEFCHCYLC